MAPVPKANYRWDGSDQTAVDMKDSRQVFALAELKNEAKKKLRDMPDYEKKVEEYFNALGRSAEKAGNRPQGGFMPLGDKAEQKMNDTIAEGRRDFGKIVAGTLMQYGLRDVVGPAVDKPENLKYGNEIYWDIMQEENKRILEEKTKTLKIVPPVVPNIMPREGKSPP